MVFFDAQNSNVRLFEGPGMKNTDIFYVHLVYFGKFYVHLVYLGKFDVHLVNFMVNLHTFSRFGMLCQETSGNPAVFNQSVLRASEFLV
jgi:hypothetical protein